MNVGQVGLNLGRNTIRLLKSSTTRGFGSSAVCMRREKQQWTRVKEKWDHRKGEWISFFNYFAPEKGITVDMLHAIQKPIDISPKAIKDWYRRYKLTKITIDQMHSDDRVAALGSELAAAHFIVFRYGKILQKGSDKWIEIDEKDKYDLPCHYTPEFFLECIDASGTKIMYEGLECIGQLDHLKWLSVANCEYIDDWCIDRICGQHASTLEYLNLSNCPRITHLGIAALSKLKHLKTLDLTGLHSILDIELLCLLLEDLNPAIDIIGIDYMTMPVLQDKLE